MKILTALLLFSFLAACSKTASTTGPAVKKTSNSEGENSTGASLTLSWKVLPEMSTYHIFYVDTKKKVREIDSISKDDEAFQDGKIIVNKTNMEVWPKSGEKACFYVVADLEGFKSDPSAQACITL